MSFEKVLMNSIHKAVTPLVRNTIHNSVSNSVSSLSRIGMNIKSSSLLDSSVKHTNISVSSSRMYRTPPFDMKPGFRKSPKAHVTKDGKGWYLNVPFRHKATSMPRSIYNQAKQLNQGESLEVSDPLASSWTGYKHKANKYSGLRRMVNSTYGKYYTFRRVSNKSDPLSWWHPGTELFSPISPDNQIIKQTVSDFIVANINSALRR